MAGRLNASLSVRFAALTHDLGKGTTPADVLPRHIGHESRSAKIDAALAERLRVPNDCRELADVVAREHGNIHRSENLAAAATVRLLERCDAIRKPARFAQVLQACECDARGRLGFEDGVSCGMMYELDPIPTEGSDEEYLDTCMRKVKSALSAQRPHSQPELSD